MAKKRKNKRFKIFPTGFKQIDLAFKSQYMVNATEVMATVEAAKRVDAPIVAQATAAQAQVA